MKRFVWATALVLTACVGAHAEFDWKKHYLMDPPRQKEISDFNAINSVRFASDIAAYCKAGQQTVVPLTPKEQEWLDKVAPDGQLDLLDKRSLEVAKNSIYLRSRVLGFYENCEAWTDEAVLSHMMSLRSSVKTWGRLATLLFKYDFLIGDAVNTLRQRGEAVDQGMDKVLGTEFHLMVAASRILEVLPSAQTNN